MTSSRRVKRDQGPGVSLFPFLAVLLCTMGMLIMLLVLISRDTADQDGGDVHARIQTDQQTVSPDDDLFSEEAFEKFQTPTETETASFIPPPETTVTATTSPDTVTPEMSSVPPMETPEEIETPKTASEQATEDALYEEYRRLYGEMNPEEMELQRETADWFVSELKGVRDRTEKELADQRTKLAEAEAAIGGLMKQLIELNAKAIDLKKKPMPDGEANEGESLQTEIEKKAEEVAALHAEIERLKVKTTGSEEKTTYAIVPYRGKSGTFRRPIYVECSGNGIYLMPEKIPFIPEDFIVARYPGNPFDAGLRAARQYFVEKGEGSAENEPYPLLILRPEAAQQYYAAKAALASWGGEFGYEFVEEDSEIEYPKPDPELKKRVEEQVALARARLAGPLAALMNEMEAARGGFSEEIGNDGGIGNGAGGGRGDGMLAGDAGVDGIGSQPLASRLGPYAKIDSASDSSVDGFGDNTRSNGVELAGGTGIRPQVGTGNETAVPFEAGVNHSEVAAISGDDFPDTGDYFPAPSETGYGGEVGRMRTVENGAGNATMTPSEGGRISETVTDTAMTSSGPQSSSATAMDGNSSDGGSVFASNSAAPSETTETAGDFAMTPFAEYSMGDREKTDGAPTSDPIDPRQTVGNTAFLQGADGEKTSVTDVETAVMSDGGKDGPNKKPVEPKVKSQRDGRAINLAEEFRKPSQMAIERPITVECRPNEIIFVKQAGMREARTVPFGPNSHGEQVILETIVFCVRSWNVAGRNMYWSPWMKVNMAPGGEETFDRFRRLMESQKVRVDRTSGMN